MCSNQPAPSSPGSEVSGHKIPQEHFHDLHPQLSRQEPADHLHLLRWRHEGTDGGAIRIQRDEPDGRRYEMCAIPIK